MTKRSLFTWIGLITLTLVTGLIFMSDLKYGVVLIMLLSAIKFMLVGFEFMEIKAAHNFWKIALTAFLFIFMVIVFAAQ